MFSVSDTMSEVVSWIVSNWLVNIWGTVQTWISDLVTLGNGFFRASINMCAGMIYYPPSQTLPEAWLAMKNIATGGAFMGIASDLVIVGFLISLIEYSISVRSRMELEDLIKMFGRMCLANYLVHNFISIIEGLWDVGTRLVGIIMPVTDDDMITDYAFSLPVFHLVWIIIAVVYAVVMITISFKIITSFYERFLWAFLMIPFGGPAIATVVGYGHFNQTFKAYIKYAIATVLEFVAFALLIVLLSSAAGGFKDLLKDWVSVGVGEGNLLVGVALGYLCNICFASMVAGMITKLDNQLYKMLAL